MKKFQNLHGNPQIIVSYKDPIFISNFQTSLFSCLSTQLAHSASSLPRFDGKTKILNKFFEGYLDYFASNK